MEMIFFSSSVFAKVGDVIGVGIYPKTRKLFLSKNGELFRGELAEVGPKSLTEMPAVRCKGEKDSAHFYRRFVCR